MKEFEVIDQYNGRHRYNVSDGYSWAWRPKTGTMDVDGTDFLDIYKEESDFIDLVETFPHPAKVGYVTENSCHQTPFRDMPVEKCPRCGTIKDTFSTIREECAKQLEVSNSELLLRCGEMKSEELRLVRAVLKYFSWKIRNISQL